MLKDVSHWKVRDVMTTDVYIVQPDTTMLQVAKIFASKGFHHLPVVDEGQLVGMISKGDLLHLSHAFPLDDPDRRNERDGELFARMLAGEIMTRQLVRLRPDMPVTVAVGIFLENLVHALPVVDEDEGLVGILTTMDLLRLAYVPQRAVK